MRSYSQLSNNVLSQRCFGFCTSWLPLVFVSTFLSFKFIVCGYYTIDVYKIFGDSRPTLDHEVYLTEVGSFASLFGSLRFIWSAALDHYSYKKVYGTLLIL